LRSARPQIHFSFDGSTPKLYSLFLGINAQFVDRDFAQHRVLLGLRPLRGRHTGLSLADEVADTLAFWQIEGPDRVGYFTLDNAASNDTCIKALAAEHGFCLGERRVRCAGHIFNLCVRAMLYGSKGEDFGAIIRAKCASSFRHWFGCMPFSAAEQACPARLTSPRLLGWCFSW
jgi:hypothetical protein